jgi:RNA polymerase sigma factor (sigma-70 family)
MAPRHDLIQTIRHVALHLDSAERTDADLLGAFVAQNEGAAFEALVRRHGPMVLGVCRRVLGNEADVEDAFQATFLVLICKAAAIVPRALVGNWLYGVARNTALKAKAMNRKRRVKEREAADRPRPEGVAEGTDQRQALLDEELGRLPECYRAVLVLCDLEGRTRKEAARLFDVPEGTVAGRLARARALLAERLARRGLAVSVGALAVLLSESASANVAPVLVRSLIQAAASGTLRGAVTAGVVSARVAALAEGVMQTMFLTRTKVLMALLLATALLGGSAGLLVPHGSAEPAREGASTKDEPKAPDKKVARKKEALPPAEKKALDALTKAFALKAGEDVKCVRPPYPGARNEWFREANKRRVMVVGTDDPPSAMVFRFRKTGELQNWGLTLSPGGYSLTGLLMALVGTAPEEMEGDRALIEAKVEADFIVREVAPATKVVEQLGAILRKELDWQGKLAFRDVERMVYVASGTYRFVPVKGRPANRIEVYTKDLSDPRFGGGGSGNMVELLQGVGQFIGKRIVVGKIEGAPKDRISWHYNHPDKDFTPAEWDEAHDPKTVLKRVAEQTGLTFKEEKRRVRVLFVERKE